MGHYESHKVATLNKSEVGNRDMMLYTNVTISNAQVLTHLSKKQSTLSQQQINTKLYETDPFKLYIQLSAHVLSWYVPVNMYIHLNYLAQHVHKQAQALLVTFIL